MNAETYEASDRAAHIVKVVHKWSIVMGVPLHAMWNAHENPTGHRILQHVGHVPDGELERVLTICRGVVINLSQFAADATPRPAVAASVPAEPSPALGDPRPLRSGADAAPSFWRWLANKVRGWWYS